MMAEHCHCHRRDAPLKLKNKVAHTTITMFLTYYGGMLCLFRNTVILQCFVAVNWAAEKASIL